MKKLLAIFLSLVMVLCLAACGGASDDEYEDDWETEDVESSDEETTAAHADSGHNHQAPASTAGDLVFTFFGNNEVPEGVTWGDCTLITLPDGGHVLVDACEGGYENSIVQDIKDMGITSIETAIFSHYHSDHYGGFDSFVDTFGVKNIYIDGFELDESISWNTNAQPLRGWISKYEAKGCTVTTTMAGDEYEIGGVKFEILYPKQDTAGATTNDTSNVMRISYGGLVALFCGDLYYTGESACLAEVDNALLKADLMKIMHHGANTSGSEEFIKAVSPKVAVAMGGHVINNLGLSRYSKVGAEVCQVWETGNTFVQFHDGDAAPYVWTEF